MNKPMNEHQPTSINESVGLDIVQLLYAGLPLAIVSNALLAAVVVPLLWTEANSNSVYVWVGMLALALIFRLITVLTWRKSSITIVNYHSWLLRFRIGAMATGLAWGACTVLLFPINDVVNQLFFAFVLTALMAGAVSSLSVDRFALIGYVAPLLFPLMLKLLLLNSEVSLAMLGAMAVFAVFMFVIAGRFSASEQSNIRHRHEMKLRENMLSRHDFIVNTVSDMMSMVNRSGQYEAVNESWCKVVGRSREDVIGRSTSEVWGSPLQVDAEIARCFAEGVEISAQAVIEMPKIGRRECIVTCYPYGQTAGDITHVVIVTRDITALAESQRELVKARDAAESASRAKSEFLASMSHELRTPLNAILGFSQLFVMDEELTNETRECAGEIERAGHHLLALVDDLIDLARIESGKLDLSLEPVSVACVLSGSLSLIAPIAKKHAIKLIDENSKNMNVTVQADNVRLNQTLLNLLSNAVKYNRPDGSVTLSSQINDGRIRINIIDTGLGIPVESQARIFNAFDRLGAERGQIEGTGIGLVITRRIVESMGGMIGFSSDVGKGSTFWIEFPVTGSFELPQAELEVSKSMQVEGDNPDRPQPKVLLVEDNMVNRLIVNKLFSARSKLLLLEAETAEDGIVLAKSEKPDLILMDINLPGMDGYEALKVLKKDAETSHIKVVALSANAMTGDDAKGRAAGFDDYLTKPINVQNLFSVIDKMISTEEDTR